MRKDPIQPLIIFILAVVSLIVTLYLYGYRNHEIAYVNTFIRDNTSYAKAKLNSTTTPISTPVTSSNKTRILISGLGHSGTSYVQQFIGDVLLNEKNIFYLFEVTHSQTISYQLSFYRNHTNLSVHTANDVISLYFDCKFPLNMNYTNAFRHWKHIHRINNMNGINGKRLKQKCLSSEYLIYKEIHLNLNHVVSLWKQFPKLKIIAMVRNPLTHIPSNGRMTKNQQSIEKRISVFCPKQLKNIQYGLRLGQNDIFGIHQFYVFRMEDFFVNITHKFSASVTYYSQNVLDMKWNARNEFSILKKLNVSYNAMLGKLWPWFNEKKPLKRHQRLKAHEVQSIKDGCKAFNDYFRY